MSPASSQELKVERCATKIEYLEKAINELKEKFENLRSEKTRNQERTSDRKSAIYVAILTISIALLIEILKWLVL